MKGAAGKAAYIIKLLIIGFIISGVILLVLSFLMFKTEVTAAVISGGLLFAYILPCFIGGMSFGKKMGTKKYLWGLLFGLIYGLLLFIISFVVKSVAGDMGDNALTIILLCAAGGMLGGMLG